MKVSAIKNNCRAKRIGIILNSAWGDQWITNGQSAWLVEGMRMDQEALKSLFDLSEKQLGKWLIEERQTKDTRFTATPMEYEEKTDDAGALVYADSVFIGVRSSRGMLYIPYEAIRHIKEEYRSYAVRWRNGKPMVAVYGGMFCQALLMPASNVWAGLLRDRARALDAPTYEWPDPEQEAADAEAEAEALLRMLDDDGGGTDGD